LIMKAQDCYLAKDFDCAKRAIDSAMLYNDARTDAHAWQTKAFVYYELAKKLDGLKLNSPLRDSSIKAAQISHSLKADPANMAIIKKQAEKYYNLCIKLLYDSLNYNNSSTAYKRYKELYYLVDSTFDFRSKDIEFYSAVGSQFSDLFNQNNTKVEYGEVGKISLMKVIELDPKNISANINLGIIYYNQGVNLINSMDLDTPLDKLEVIQDNSAKLFKQSLPFMNKVYQLDPKNLKALESLRQIYQALNEPEKSLEFNKKLEEAKKGQ
jgi:tetratricopeptide (TPR) repeat protein